MPAIDLVVPTVSYHHNHLDTSPTISCSSRFVSNCCAIAPDISGVDAHCLFTETQCFSRHLAQSTVFIHLSHNQILSCLHGRSMISTVLDAICRSESSRSVAVFCLKFENDAVFVFCALPLTCLRTLPVCLGSSHFAPRVAAACYRRSHTPCSLAGT